MFRPGLLLRRLVLCLAVTAVHARADLDPGLRPVVLPNPQADNYSAEAWSYREGDLACWGVYHQTVLDPAGPSLTGLTRPYDAGSLTNSYLIAISRERLLVRGYADNSPYRILNAADLSEISTVILPDGWAFRRSGKISADGFGNLFAGEVSRPEPGYPTRTQTGCAMVDLRTGFVKILQLSASGGTGAALAGLTLREGCLAYIYGTTAYDIVQSGELRILDVASGSQLGFLNIIRPFRILDMSADRIAYQHGSDILVSPLNFALAGKLATVGDYEYPGVALRGRSAWFVSNRTRRYDLDNPLHPVLLDDLDLSGTTGGSTYGYGESWIARFENGTGTVYFYDLSENAPNHIPLARVNGGTARERDGHVTATVTLSKVSPVDTSVRLTTADASARAGQDYTATDLRMTIPAGALSGTVEIPLIEDSVVEGNESFFIRLSEPQGLRTGTGSSTAVILGSGVACWERSLAGSPAYADAAQVGTTFGTILAATDTRVVARVADGTPNAGKIALYDIETLRLLKILNVPTNYLLSLTVEGNKVRIVNAPWTSADCTQIDAETGVIDSTGHVDVPIGFYEYARYFWQDSHHVVVVPQQGSVWTVYDITDGSSSTVTLPGSVAGTNAFAVDDHHVAASVVTQTSPYVTDKRLSVRVYDRATLAPVGTFPFPADPRSNPGNGALDSRINLIPGAFVTFCGDRADACDVLTGATRWTTTGISMNAGINIPPVPLANGNLILLPKSESTYQVMDGTSGAFLDTYDTYRSGYYYESYYRLDPSVSGFCGTDRKKAFRVFSVPNEPVFDADPVTGPENATLTATLRPRECLLTARPLSSQELPPLSGATEFAKMPGSATAVPGLTDSTAILTPANDRQLRTDDRTATVTFAATAHPWEIVCRLTATVTEDDATLPAVPPYAVNPATGPAGTLRLAVSSPWIVSDDGATISVYSSATGAFLRSFAVPMQDPYATFLIQGGRLFYATPGLDLIKLGKTYYDVGAVSVYDLATGQLAATLANNITTERFGYVMAASDRYLAVGATLSTSTGGSAGGSISVFDLTTLKRVLRKTSTAANYGKSIAVWQDRLYYGVTDTVLKTPTGEQYRNTGSVTALLLPRGTALTTLTAPRPPGGFYFDGIYYGTSIAISGSKLVVSETDADYSYYGRGAIHAYNLTDHSLAWSLRRADVGDTGLNNVPDIDPRVIPGGDTLGLVQPATFIDLPTGRILGSRLSSAAPSYLTSPGAIDGGYYYWADTAIRRVPIPKLPVPPTPPDPPVDPGPAADPASFTQWINSNIGFGGPPAGRALDADPDGDGLSNWQEFVLGSHPGRPGAKSPVITQYPGWVAMTYRRANPSIGRPVYPEFSTDLIHWTRQTPDWCEVWSQDTTNGVETLELDIETAATPKGWVRFSFTE